MQSKERLVIPALGLVIILATFMLGVPLVYRVLLGLLGLAVVGTHFAPQAVQVETRIAIAALGLIILLIVSSTAFWLALLSFGAIGALQFPHRGTLQRNPATFTWLSTLLKRAQARRAAQGAAAVGGDEEAEVTATVGGGTSGNLSVAGISAALPGFVRMNVAGLGGPVVGAIVLGSVFMPWYGFLVSVLGELVGGPNLTLRAGAEELGLTAISAFFYLLLVLGVLSIISIGLPRLVAGIIAAGGLVVTLASYLYVLAAVEREAAELRNIGADVLTIPSSGCLLAGVVFLIMFVLQLIPKANKTIGARAG